LVGVAGTVAGTLLTPQGNVPFNPEGIRILSALKHVESLRRLGIPVRGALGSSGETNAAACNSLNLERAYTSLDELASDAYLSTA
jgi:hypothetical protein